MAFRFLHQDKKMYCSVMMIILMMLMKTEAKNYGLKVTIDNPSLWVSDLGPGWSYHSWMKDGKTSAIKHFGEWDIDQSGKMFWVDDQVASFLSDGVDDTFFITIQRPDPKQKEGGPLQPSKTVLLAGVISNNQSVNAKKKNNNYYNAPSAATFPLVIGNPSFGKAVTTSKAKFCVDYPITDPHGIDPDEIAIMFAVQTWGT